MFYRLVVWGLRGFFRLFYRFHIEYACESYPQGAIIAPNHASFLDPPVVAAACREDVYFLARSSLFRKTWWAWVLQHLHSHPIEGSLQDLSSLRSVIELLRQGKKVVLFPEGGRTETGELQSVKMGVAMLSLRAGVPIIPVFIQGTFEAWPRHSFWPKWGKSICCFFGEPIFPPPATKHLQKKEAQQVLLRQIEESLKELQQQAERRQ